MISIYITLYYDLDFLKDIISYLNKYVDEIIIVDGPYEYCIPFLKKLNLYYDENNKPIELQNIINDNNKIKYFYKHWNNEKEKRMFGYEQCNHDIILLVDGDEFILIDEIKLNNFINSDKNVAGFDIHNMNRINVNIDKKSKKNIMFKKNNITSYQHLSYTWLIGVSDLEKQDVRNIYVKETIGTIYHQTLNRTKKNNIIKYIFYTRLYHIINNNINNNFIGYDIDLLLSKIKINDLLNCFYHSSIELIGIPKDKLLHRNNDVMINLDKYKNNHIEGYFKYNEITLRHVDYYCYVDLKYDDNNIVILFDNVKNVKVSLYKIEYDKHYIVYDYINNKNNEIRINYIANTTETLNYVLKITIIQTIDNDIVCKINNIYVNKLNTIPFKNMTFDEIIPLGEECYTCMSIDNKFNSILLRKNSHPFDYVGHVFIDKINQKLKNMDLINDTDIIIKNFNPKYFYVDQKYGFNYWHDLTYDDCNLFTEDNNKSFIDKYNKKYERLYDMLKNIKCLCISVCHFDTIYKNEYKKNELIELYNTLNSINNNTYFIAFNYDENDFEYEKLLHINLKYIKEDDFKKSKKNFETVLNTYVKNMFN